MRAARHPSFRPLLAIALAAGAALGASACESGFDRNDQIVNSVRILGVRSHISNGDGIDWADADAGDTVEFSALVTNPNDDPSVSVTWLACLPIPGQISPCTFEGTLRDPTMLIRMADDPSTGVILLGVGNPIAYTIPSEFQYLLQPLIDRAKQAVNAECGIYTGIPLIVIAEGSDRKPFTAQKNIRLSPWREIGQYSSAPALQFYERNANPTVGALNIDPPTLGECMGTTLTTFCQTDGDCAATGGTCENNFCSPAAFPAGPRVVCVELGQAQSYYNCDLDGPILDFPGEGPNVPEEPTMIWYMTAGSLSGFAAPAGGGSSLASRTFTGFTRPPGPFTLYGVARDVRDGESWIAQDFQ